MGGTWITHGEIKSAYKIFIHNLKGKEHMGNTGVGERTILK
jgi:hypothetical protein